MPRQRASQLVTTENRQALEARLQATQPYEFAGAPLPKELDPRPSSQSLEREYGLSGLVTTVLPNKALRVAGVAGFFVSGVLRGAGVDGTALAAGLAGVAMAARHALYHLLPLEYELPGLNAEAGLLPLRKRLLGLSFKGGTEEDVEQFVRHKKSGYRKVPVILEGMSDSLMAGGAFLAGNMLGTYLR